MKKFNYDALFEECREAYYSGGAYEVYYICKDMDGIEYTPCVPCDEETPSHESHPTVCLVCGGAK